MNETKFDERSCARVRSYLDSYTNDELLDETKHGVQRHLEECRNCAGELESRARVKSLLQRAVSQETAPAALRARIQESIRATQPVTIFGFSRQQMALAACAFVAMCLGVWGVLQERNGGRVNLDASLSEQMRKVLNIGLRDHVHCALDNEVKKDFFTFEKVPAAVRTEYVELISSVKRQVGDNYEVAAHNCAVDGREFIHVILKRGENVLSLVMTKGNGERFESVAHVASFDAASAPLYRGRLQGLEVVGLETPSHLAFVVSNLPEKESLQFASNVAPSVRDFLAKMEAAA